MKRWSRRIGYLFVILLWLVLISFPVVAFLLATTGQIEIGDNQSGLRVFLLQDTENQGVGLQWTRSYNYSSVDNQASANCNRTSLRYFLWDGNAENQNSDYCQCFDSQTQQPLPLSACSLP